MAQASSAVQLQWNLEFKDTALAERVARIGPVFFGRMAASTPHAAKQQPRPPHASGARWNFVPEFCRSTHVPRTCTIQPVDDPCNWRKCRVGTDM
eukprot:3356390-Prymnesium_polylepis.1